MFQLRDPEQVAWIPDDSHSCSFLTFCTRSHFHSGYNPSWGAGRCNACWSTGLEGSLRSPARQPNKWESLRHTARTGFLPFSLLIIHFLVFSVPSPYLSVLFLLALFLLCCFSPWLALSCSSLLHLRSVCLSLLCYISLSLSIVFSLSPVFC